MSCVWREVAISIALAGCSSPCLTPLDYEVVTGPRDWDLYPAITNVDSTATTYALSDVHGGYARMIALLATAGLIDANIVSPDAAVWRGGSATLIVLGDLIDKGPQGLEVIEAMQALETSAAASGGRVVVLVGNHEAELLADPHNCKASDDDGLDTELRRDEVDPVTFASGADPRGAWLRVRSFAARRGRWLFAHAGDTAGRSLPELTAAIRTDVETNDYAGQESIGSGSLLEARGWYDSPSRVATNLAAADVDHIVFGHTPDALGPRGAIAVANGGATIRIDCGLSPNVDDSDGALLKIETVDGVDTASELTASGRLRSLL